MEVLNVQSKLEYVNDIVREELHSYSPRTPSYKNNDEFSFHINNENIYTLPSESFIEIRGDVQVLKQSTKEAHKLDGDNFNLTNNAYAFLFREIRYLLNDFEICRTNEVGISTTLKGYVSYTVEETKLLELAGWLSSPEARQPNFNKDTGKFYALIPLRFLLGFMEDYRKVLFMQRQELIFYRARGDENSYISNLTDLEVKFNILSVEWKIQHIKPNDKIHYEFLHLLKNDKSIIMPFRKWEFRELPSLGNSSKEEWVMRLSSSTARPHQILLAFQTDRSFNAKKNAALFDHINLRNIKVYINEVQYPYTDLNLNFADGYSPLAYQMFTSFIKNYYNKKDSCSVPNITYQTFGKSCTIFVIDCMAQDESIKNSGVDLRVSFETRDPVFKDRTKAYSLILSDSLAEYKTQTGATRHIL